MRYTTSKHILTTLFCFLQLISVDAQEYFTSAQQYTVEDGLTDNNTREIYRDSKGYIWIPTSSGLDKFDGHEFIHYDKEKNGLISNSIESVFEDRNSQLWIVSQGKWNTDGLTFYTKRIDIFDPALEKANSLEQTLSPPFESADMRWFFEDHQKNIWISTKQGALYKYDGKTLSLIFQKEVSQDWLGRFAIATDGKIGFLERHQITIADSIGQVLYTSDLPYDCVLVYAGLNGDIWVANTRSHPDDNRELRFWFVKGNQQFEPFYLRDRNGERFKIGEGENIYTSFRMDKNGRFWGFVDESLLLFDKNGILTYDFTEILELYDLSAESLLFNFGAENFLWLSSYKGIFSIALRENKFQKIISTSDFAIDAFIIEDDHGNRLISQKDIFKFNQNNQIIGHIPIEYAIIAAKDKQGKIWWGDRNYSFHLYDPLTGDIQTVSPNNNSKASFNETLFIRRPILSLHVNEHNQQLYIGLREGGISVLDLNGGNIEPFTHYNSFPQLKDLIVKHFHKSKEGIWLSTNEGLFLVSEHKGVLAHFKQSKNGIDFGDIYSIHEDEEKIFWLATNGNGLIKWDRANQEAIQFSRNDGLSHSVIYAVYEDDFGRLWLPSAYGLMQFNKLTNEILAWSTDDGLPFNEFDYNYHYQTSDGQLLLGGAEGDAIRFYPSQARRNTVDLSISRYLEFDNKAAVFKDQSTRIYDQEEIQIPPAVNIAMLKVSMREFTSPHNIEYAYKIDRELKKEQTNWNFQKDNTIRLNNLTFGNHILEVKAVGTDNQKTKGFLRVPIFVKKPFYLKTWFLLLSLLIFITSVFAIIRWRNFQLQQDKIRLEKEVRERTKTISQQKEELETANATKDRLFAIIGHDLRGPLFNLQGLEEQINYLLETGQQERLKELGAKMEQTTKHLAETLNSILNWSMLQMGKFPYQPEPVNVKQSVHSVTALFEGAADAKGIIIYINVPEKIDANVDRNALNTILRNMFSNALKFSSSGDEIKIEAHNSGPITTIQVSDSGIGMSPSQVDGLLKGKSMAKKRGTRGEKSTGLGWLLLRDLIEQNRGSFQIDSEIGKGTTIKINFPAAQQAIPE